MCSQGTCMYTSFRDSEFLCSGECVQVETNKPMGTRKVVLNNASVSLKT